MVIEEGFEEEYEEIYKEVRLKRRVILLSLGFGALMGAIVYLAFEVAVPAFHEAPPAVQMLKGVVAAFVFAGTTASGILVGRRVWRRALEG